MTWPGCWMPTSPLRRVRRAASLPGSRYWAGVREVEELILERVEAGIKQFTRADYWAARGERLLAESQLSQERGDIRKPLPGTLRSAFDDPNPLAAGPTARAEFEAMRSTPGALSLATREASSREYEARTRPRMTDSPTMPVVASFRRIAAERTAGRDAAEALASLERLWLLTWKDEQVTWEQVEAGIKEISPADYYDARDARLEAGIAIAAARRQPDKPLPLKGGLQDAFAANRDAPLDTKDVARAKSEATRADVGEQNRQRRETLLTAYALRIRRFKTWRDTPDVISAVSRRPADAELPPRRREGGAPGRPGTPVGTGRRDRGPRPRENKAEPETLPPVGLPPGGILGCPLRPHPG